MITLKRILCEDLKHFKLLMQVFKEPTILQFHMICRTVQTITQALDYAMSEGELLPSTFTRYSFHFPRKIIMCTVKAQLWHLVLS